MFGKMLDNSAGSAISSVGYGSTAGAIASHTTSTVIYTAAYAAGNVKAKDELTLDIKVNQTGGNTALSPNNIKQKPNPTAKTLSRPSSNKPRK